MGIFSVSSVGQETIFRYFLLGLICVLVLFTRSTKYLVDHGFYDFHNWFDPESWYPLGRIVGSTVYPGLMYTGATIYYILNFFHLTVNIRNICVLTAPIFSAFTALATYLLTSDSSDSTSAGLVAAALVAIVPGYISRSVAGSFDNEGIAIFALIFTFWLWVRSVKTGSIFWGTLCSLAYFYMVTAWGGYIFIINLIPLHVVVLLVTGYFSSRVYVAYNTFYVVGTILAMHVRFVGFQAVQSSEHLAAFGTFGLLQLYTFIQYLKGMLSPDMFKRVTRMFLIVGGVILLAGFIVGQITGVLAPFTGRFYSFLDPTYAKDHIPIIASVSEHQPTTWSSYFFDLHLLVFLFPAGLYFCFRRLTDVSIFAIIYGVTSVYFSGVMVRLMLVLAPISCVLAGIAISETLKTYCKLVKTKVEKSISKEVGYAMLVGLTFLLVFYTLHCTWVTSEAYSSPSIVLAARQPDGSKYIFDDFREAYWWLSMNTERDAKVMSWWDYGYQIAGMGNRTVIVDNNTWNNSHIALVGTAMASNESKAIGIVRTLDVDYVLVIFGGVTGYSSDDINKFLWMVRIGGTVDKSVKEMDYYTANGEFRIDQGGSPTLQNCLMYKLCYYRYHEVHTEGSRGTGFDRARGAVVGNPISHLEYFEEAFTSQHWIVRIYKVKPQENRGPN